MGLFSLRPVLDVCQKCCCMPHACVSWIRAKIINTKCLQEKWVIKVALTRVFFCGLWKHDWYYANSFHASMSAGQKHQGKSRVPAVLLWEIRLCLLPLRGTKHKLDLELQNETRVLVFFVNYWLQNIWVVLGAHCFYQVAVEECL